MMELTRDKLLHIERISADPEKRELASALIAEMNKPKVWDGAPEWATDARVRWTDRNGVTGHNDMYSQLYSRIPAKYRIDEIAEEAKDLYMATSAGDRDGLTHIIKSAILQARKEWEAER